MLDDYLWFGAALYVSFWLNTVTGIQMVFIDRFLYDTIRKEDVNNIKYKQTPLSFQTR